MPEYKEPVQLEHVDPEQQDVLDAAATLKAEEALSLVMGDFDSYEAFRGPNHDRRWTQNDALYFGNVPVRYWEGTTTPRSSLAWPITFEQIETAYAAIVQAIFGPSTDWFGVEAAEGTDVKLAQKKQEMLRTKLAQPRYGYGVSGIRELCRAIRSLLQYGLGGVEIKWDAEVNDGCVEWVDIRDFYFDPSAATPVLEDSRSVIRRKFFTVLELDALRGQPGMSIPPMEVLNALARTPDVATGDNTKRVQEALRGVNYTPQSTAAPMFPADRKVEVLMYYSKSRCIWVLGRKVVAYNEENPYKFIPFAFAPWIEVLGRLYGLSVPDRLEETQRYMEALRNLRLDGINLDIMPPRIMKRSLGATPSQLKFAPGKITFDDDPKNAMIETRPTSINGDLSAEVADLELIAEKRTGISSSQQGIFRAGNANRTAGGMQMQVQGGALRLSTVIGNIEDYLILPMLYKLDALLQFHNVSESTPEQIMQGQVPPEQLQQEQAVNAKVKFTMVAASHMVTREKLAQMLPFLGQTLLNPGMQQELSRIGKTLDVEQFVKMAMDAGGVGNLYQLVRDLTPQEQQAMQQPDPQTMAKMQQAQLEAQTRKEIMDKKVQADQQNKAMDQEHRSNELDEKSSMGILKIILDSMKHNKDSQNEKTAQVMQLLSPGAAPAQQGPPNL